MTGELVTYLWISALVAAVLGAVNFLRPGRRWLAYAFFALAFTNLAYLRLPEAVTVATGGTVVVLLLIADVWTRAGKRR